MTRLLVVEHAHRLDRRRRPGSPIRSDNSRSPCDWGARVSGDHRSYLFWAVPLLILVGSVQARDCCQLLWPLRPGRRNPPSCPSGSRMAEARRRKSWTAVIGIRKRRVSPAARTDALRFAVTFQGSVTLLSQRPIVTAPNGAETVRSLSNVAASLRLPGWNIRYPPHGTAASPSATVLKGSKNVPDSRWKMSPG